MNISTIPAAQPIAACQKCEQGVIISAGGEDTVAARAVACRCSVNCETCGNTGFVFSWSEGYLSSEFCPACEPLRQRIKRFNDAHIPRRYTSSTFENYEPASPSQRAALALFTNRLESWVPGQRGVLLSGGVGTGKTHLMCAWLRHMTVHRHTQGMFVEFSHLLADIRAGYDAGKSDAQIIRPLADIPILVIDELGKSLKTDWQLGILDALISHRYERAKSTFFTTNYAFEAPSVRDAYSSDDFAKRSLNDVIGERMASRIDEMCDRATIQGADFRRRAQSSSPWRSTASASLNRG